MVDAKTLVSKHYSTDNLSIKKGKVYLYNGLIKLSINNSGAPDMHLNYSCPKYFNLHRAVRKQ